MEELLELAILLVVKFWPVILAFLGFKAIGKVRRDAQKRPGAQRPVLTPVHGGGFPKPEPGRVIVSRKEEEREEQVMFPYEDKSLSEQPAFQEMKPIMTHTAKKPANVNRANAFTEREGMKWALIFSPPRAKMPYTRPGYQKKQ